MSIIADKISHIYDRGSGNETYALKNVSFAIEDGEFIGLIGHTGSGKSTLIQHLNGLVRATEGTVYYNGQDIYDPEYNMKELRRHVGLVFQYPEHQLFETEIFKDVCFGPLNLGLSEKDAQFRAFDALRQVGLEENLYYQSPFDLSGGQKRRVAIAGVLAMKPDVLILDEPTAGLDPNERIRFRNLLSEFAQDRLVLLSTHIVSDIETIASQVIMLRDHRLYCCDSPANICAALRGKVFEVPAELPLGAETFLLGERQGGQGTMLRVVTDCPPVQAAAVEPGLEDAFLYIYGE